MFRRRKPLTLWRRLRVWFWPDIGWRRLTIYALKRMTRLPGTPHSIAAGLACGIAISFTPFVGLHILGSIGLAFLVRGHYLAAAAGTLVGNPWTFPFMWLASYEVGEFFLSDPGSLDHPVRELGLATLLNHPSAVLWPLTAGGVPLGLLVGLISYVPMVRTIAAFQEARRRRREHRRRSRLRVRAASASPDPGIT